MNFMRPHSPFALISLLLAALMCFVPFLIPHHQTLLATFYGEWLAAALGLVASALLLRRASWQPFRFPVVALVPLGLMVVLGVQVAVGLAVYWQQHFLVSLYLLWAALMVVLGSELRREFGLEKLVPVLAWAVLAGGLLSAVVVALQMTGMDFTPYIVPHKAAGYAANFMRIGHLANYLTLALASLLYLAVTARIKTGWSVLLAVLLLFPLALAGQRMGWVYVVMLAVGGWLAGRKYSDKSWHMLGLVPVFLAVQLIVPLLATGGAAAIPAIPTQGFAEGMQGSAIRLELVREAWDIFLAHPWLGAGWGQFGWQDFLLAETYPNHTGHVGNAHNIVMQLLAETGVAGTLVFMAGLGVWARYVVPATRGAEHWWLYAMFAVLGIYTLFEYTLWYACFLGVAALLLGLAEENARSIKLDLGQLAIAAILAFGVFSLINLGTHYARLEKMTGQMITVRKDAGKLNAMLDSLDAIRRSSILAPYADRMMLQLLPNTPELNAQLASVNGKNIRSLPHAREVYRQALLLALDGKKDAAMRQLRLAMIRHPEGLHQFSITLANAISRQTMPLLVMVIRHNRAELGLPPEFEIPESLK